MKKFLALALCVLMAVSMLASVSAVKPAKEYAAAKDGDLLYTANFKNDGVAKIGTATVSTFTASADGKSVTIKGTGSKDVANWWGVKLETLTAANGEKYTVTYKVKSNGTVGKNNSIGVGALWAGTAEDKFYHAYGNYNTVDAKGSTADRRISISLAGSKMGDYNTSIKNPDTDKDGFMSAKQEIDTAAKKIRTYTLVGGKWVLTLEKAFTDFDAKKACMSFIVYSYYYVVDSTVKDFKIYKGINLTDAQLNPVETTAATTKAPTTKPASPATFDAAVVLAVVASMAGAGVVVSKKRK